MTGLIGRTWKHRKVWRRPVLINRPKHTPPPTTARGVVTNARNKTKEHNMFASTMQYLTQHPLQGPHKVQEGRRTHTVCPADVSVVDSGRETPGPIPNPEAKPARADGTALGRVWESKLPPTLKTTTTQ